MNDTQEDQERKFMVKFILFLLHKEINFFLYIFFHVQEILLHI